MRKLSQSVILFTAAFALAAALGPNADRASAQVHQSVATAAKARGGGQTIPIGQVTKVELPNRPLRKPPLRRSTKRSA